MAPIRSLSRRASWEVPAEPVETGPIFLRSGSGAEELS
jgi:hypothetical protein